MPYVAKGKCIYKKNTGKRVGCTKGSVKKYMGALHANVKENVFSTIYDNILNEEVGETKPTKHRSVDKLYSLLKKAGISAKSRFETNEVGAGRVSDTLIVYWDKWDTPEKKVGVVFSRIRLPDNDRVEYEPIRLTNIRPSSLSRSSEFNVTHNSMVNAVNTYIKSINTSYE